ncbi:MAG: hypothetical protein JEY99_16585 [Spirochaetales bacterium]|nr:hypothetical protein [Spirochaetales bacterium]
MDFFNIQTIVFIILFLITGIFFLFIGRRMGLEQGRKMENAEWETNKLEKIVAGRIKTSRAVLGGQFSEQIAPYLPDFPYNPSDCRFMGKPIDFIVFKGMDEKNIDEVIFVEVKSGKTRALSSQERKLRDVIQAGKVRWVQYNVSYGKEFE